MFLWTRGRIVLIVGVLINLAVLTGWLWMDHYYRTTVEVPAFGGEYIEGLVGRPINLNPLVAISDADQDINSLIFSGLTRIDREGQLVGNLAREWEISEDRLTYTFRLYDEILWHDGTPFEAEDVVFTINLIQDPNFSGSFIVRNNWAGVEVEEIDPLTVRFTLRDPYAPFLENTTIGILPAHLLQNISGAELLTASFNKAPIGTGPYRFGEVESEGSDVLSLSLKAYRFHHRVSPLIETIRFRFYPNAQEAFEGLRQRHVHALSNLPPELKEELENLRNVEIFKGTLPNYQAVYFNTKRPLFEDVRVRRALAHMTDRRALIDQVMGGRAQIADGPLPRNSWAYTTPHDTTPTYDPEKAAALLEEAGWTLNENGIRQKDDMLLQFALISDDHEERRKAAFHLAEQWAEIGVWVDVRLFGVGTFIEDFLRRREFDAAIFGQNTYWDPDLYAYWHGSQINDPGMNLSRFEHGRLDRQLEDGRRLASTRERRERYVVVQEIIREDVPAIFLYTPEYNFVANRLVKGISVGYFARPSDRLRTVANWYIETKRVKIITETTQNAPRIIDTPIRREDI